MEGKRLCRICKSTYLFTPKEKEQRICEECEREVVNRIAGLVQEVYRGRSWSRLLAGE